MTSSIDPVGPTIPIPPRPPRLRMIPQQFTGNIYLWVGLGIGFLAVLGLSWWGTSCIRNGGCFGPPAATPVVANPAGVCLTVNGDPRPCNVPMTLELRERLLTVQGQPLRSDGAWQYFTDPDFVSWVQGTVVNYVLGVTSSEQNGKFFSNVHSHEPITLTLENGSVMVFEFESNAVVDLSSSRVAFQQLQPGLTLVLLGSDGPEKQVLNFAWVSTTPGSEVVSSQYPAVGTPVPLDVATIEVLSTQYRRDAALGLPDDNGYFLIDFTVTYSGTDRLDTQAFEMTLLDAAKQPYSPAGAAAQYGAYPQAVGLLEPDETLTATVGYLVGKLPGNTVLWSVKLRPTDPQTVTFELPFSTRPAGLEARDKAQVTLASAQLSPDGASLTVTGSIVNPSGEPLTLTGADISLNTGLLQSPMTNAQPPMPWTIPAGGQTQFSLSFVKPPTSSAIFSVLGRPFVINNIP